jgi:hypothetical protein
MKNMSYILSQRTKLSRGVARFNLIVVKWTSDVFLNGIEGIYPFHQGIGQLEMKKIKKIYL